MLQVLIIGLGGFVGTVARYGVATLAYRVFGATFPYGTLAVNVLGCLAIGFVSIAAEERSLVNPTTRLYLTIGVLGGFTTFSSFGFETMTLLKTGSPGTAIFYVLVSVITGLVAVLLGGHLARSI